LNDPDPNVRDVAREKMMLKK